MPPPQTERLGVSVIDNFFSQQGWLFREQTTHDYGVDAHVEIMAQQQPTAYTLHLLGANLLSAFPGYKAASMDFKRTAQLCHSVALFELSNYLKLFSESDELGVSDINSLAHFLRKR